jgi:hypothetical protein
VWHAFPQTVFNQYSIGIQSVFSRYSISIPSVFNQYSISIQSAVSRYSIGIQSVFNRYLLHWFTDSTACVRLLQYVRAYPTWRWTPHCVTCISSNVGALIPRCCDYAIVWVFRLRLWSCDARKQYGMLNHGQVYFVIQCNILVSHFCTRHHLGIIAVVSSAPTHQSSHSLCLLPAAISPLSTSGSMGVQCEVEHHGCQMQIGFVPWLSWFPLVMAI